MHDNLTEDQRMLDDAVTRYLEREYPAAAGRAPVSEYSSPQASPHWKAWADMGLLGLALPAEVGGMGAGLPDLCVLMQRFGEYRVAEGYDHSALLAGQVLARLPETPETQRLLAGLVEGTETPVLAHTEIHGNADVGAVQTEATKDKTEWVLNGTKHSVPWGAGAGTLLVTARTDQGVAVFSVASDAENLTQSSSIGLDGRPVATLRFDGCRVGERHFLGYAGSALEIAFDVFRAGLCAEAVGAMQALLTMTVEYVRTRRQFNRPLSDFQAIQHRLADMLILLEQARALMWMAADHDPTNPDFPRIVSAAKAKCGEAARFIGEQAIHLHGGMGMTDELAVGHYVKRLLAIEYTLGTTRQHIKRFQTLSR